MKLECAFTDCGRRCIARGLCQQHYRQLCYGQILRPLACYRPRGSSPEVRFEIVGDCHVSTYATNGRGYTQISVNGRLVYAHRYVYERANGPVPEGLVLDHICRNRACVRLDHLRAVTPQVNSIENSDSIQAKNAIKTHCDSGHEFDEDNTIVRKDGSRKCRECGRVSTRAYSARREAERVIRQEAYEARLESTNGHV